MFENHIERLLEDDLQTRLVELAGSLALDADGRPLVAAEPTDPRYQRPAGGAYWRVSENGKTIQSSLSLWDGELTPLVKRHFSPTGVATEQQGPDKGEAEPSRKQEPRKDADPAKCQIQG